MFGAVYSKKCVQWPRDNYVNFSQLIIHKSQAREKTFSRERLSDLCENENINEQMFCEKICFFFRTLFALRKALTHMSANNNIQSFLTISRHVPMAIINIVSQAENKKENI